MANYLNTQMTSMADLVRGVTGEVNPLSVTSMISSLLNITGTTDTTGVIAYLERGLDNPLVDSSIESRLTFPLQATSIGPYAFASCWYLSALLKASGIKYASHAFDSANENIIPTNYNSNRSGTYNKGAAAPAREPNHSGGSIDVDPAIKAEILNADYITFNDNMHGLASTVRAIDSTATGELTMRQMVEHVSSIKAGGTNHILARLIERSIETLDVPDGTISIGPEAFHSCTHLSVISLPASVQSVAYTAMAHCAQNLNVIVHDNGCLDGYSFSGLEDPDDFNSGVHVTMIGTKKTTTSQFYSTYYDLDGNASSSVITSFVRPYVIKSGYNAGISGLYAPSFVSKLDFQDTDIILEGRGDYFGGAGFFRCNGLVSLNLTGIKAISSDAFAGCESLAYIQFPTDPILLEYGVFNGTGLQSISIPSSVKMCGEYVFGGGHSLVSAYIDSPKTGVRVLEGNSLLQSITIGPHVSEIEVSAFASCDSIYKMIIPSTVVSVQAWIFDRCEGLRKAYAECYSRRYYRSDGYWYYNDDVVGVFSRVPSNDKYYENCTLIEYQSTDSGTVSGSSTYQVTSQSMYAWRSGTTVYYTSRPVSHRYGVGYGDIMYSSTGTSFVDVFCWGFGNDCKQATISCYCASSVFFNNDGTYKVDPGVPSTCFVFL